MAVGERVGNSVGVEGLAVGEYVGDDGADVRGKVGIMLGDVVGLEEGDGVSENFSHTNGS